MIEWSSNPHLSCGIPTTLVIIPEFCPTGHENVAADHLSWIENDERSDDSEVDDNFYGETLREITTRDIPWEILGCVLPRSHCCILVVSHLWNKDKLMDADDQAIQTILLGLHGDVYAAVDSCETAKEIWERVQQIMKVNLKFLNNLQPEWKRHVTIVRQTKNLHEADFTQIYDFLKMNQDENGGIQVAQNAVQNSGNHNRLVVVPGIANQNRTGNIVAARAKGDLDEIEEVNANYILMVNLQHASTFGTQLDKAPVYDTDGSAKNDNHVTFVAPSMVQSEGTVETSSAPNEETRAHQETIYRNLVDQVAQVNMVNCNMRATNAELKSELARYKIQEQRIEISQEKYEKLEKCYQKFVYQEQCLTRKINALHLSSVKQITTLNDEISNLNKQLSKESQLFYLLWKKRKG
uniref:Uncharacterized protein n=1 Tax=Tanacetum cinerariifolium TaxID=118510 RepID=A0A699HMQ4_TANCI|nr:hypothetical protein [Tanacetum cinerariifolium]